MVKQLLLRAKQAAELCGVSRRTWDRLQASGQIPPSHKLGNSKIWKFSDLIQWIEWNMPNLDNFIKRMGAMN